MQAGAHGGAPLQFEMTACSNIMSFMSFCPIICLSVMAYCKLKVSHM